MIHKSKKIILTIATALLLSAAAVGSVFAVKSILNAEVSAAPSVTAITAAAQGQSVDGVSSATPQAVDGVSSATPQAAGTSNVTTDAVTSATPEDGHDGNHDDHDEHDEHDDDHTDDDDD